MSSPNIMKIFEEADLEQIKALLEHNLFDIDFFDINEAVAPSALTPLILVARACSKGAVKAAKLLIEKGANPKISDIQWGNNALFWSILTHPEGKADVLTSRKQLIQYLGKKDICGTGPNNDGWSPLHCAVLRKSDGLCQLLIETGCDPNEPDKQGNTPLHVAYRIQALEVAKLLIRSGAKDSLTNKSNQTPGQVLMSQRGFSREEKTCFLLEASTREAASGKRARL